MKLNFRVIGNFCYLLVIIGFLMPMAAYRGVAALLGQMNGFQYANVVIELIGGVGALLYVFFIVAIIGIVIGGLLLAKINIPAFIDWLILIALIAGIIYFFVDPPEVVLSGTYVIIIGLVMSLLAQIISTVTGISNGNFSFSIPNITINKYLLIAVILGTVIILFNIILFYGPLFFHHKILMLCGIAAIILTIVSWKKDIKILLLISCILFSIVSILTIISIFLDGGFFPLNRFYWVHMRRGNLGFLFLIPAILCFLEFRRN